jgi:hypothetical protein
MGLCDITTHPPAPSQREGEILLASGMLRKKKQFLTFAFEMDNTHAKGIPLPFGKGLGDGFLAKHLCSALAQLP